MNYSIAKYVIWLFTSLSVIVTVGCAVYAAHPWGDNYAYQGIFGFVGYLVLATMVAWAISPYIYLYLSTRRHSSYCIKNLFRTGVTLLICIGGIAAVFDTVFIHSDAQGGLIFLFLPIYQWLVIGVMELILTFIRSRNTI